MEDRICYRVYYNQSDQEWFTDISNFREASEAYERIKRWMGATNIRLVEEVTTHTVILRDAGTPRRPEMLY